jgi:hypothetical protein
LFNPNLEPVDLKGYQFTDDITHMIEGAPLLELQGYYMDFCTSIRVILADYNQYLRLGLQVSSPMMGKKLC